MAYNCILLYLVLPNIYGGVYFRRGDDVMQVDAFTTTSHTTLSDCFFEQTNDYIQYL